METLNKYREHNNYCILRELEDRQRKRNCRVTQMHER